MKPETVIAALRHCSVRNNNKCRECPAYSQGSGCLDRLHTKAADLLEAVLEDLKKSDMECDFCAHSKSGESCVDADCDCSICTADCACKDCRDNSNWQWRERRAEE